MLRWPINKVKEAIEEIHGNVVIIDETTFCGMEKKCKFVDKDYGEWWAKPSHIIHRKQGHKKRGPEKAKRTFLSIYGVDSPLKDKKIKEKVKNTCLARYGTDNPAKNTEVRKRMSSSFKAKSSEEIQKTVEKRRSTCLDRYGVDNPLKNKEIKRKAEATLIENYGVRTPMHSEQIRNKVKETCIRKYGVDNPSKSPEIIKKIENIMLQKYGTKSSMQNSDVARKNARAQSKATILRHWFSNEDIVCVGSYEISIVEYFNTNKIDYNWQVQTFTMPDGRTYRPDFYLPDKDKWIEIKGYFRKDAKEKWEWFHNEYPNSELWNKTKLKTMGLL